MYRVLLDFNGVVPELAPAKVEFYLQRMQLIPVVACVELIVLKLDDDRWSAPSHTFFLFGHPSLFSFSSLSPFFVCSVLFLFVALFD